MRVLIVEDDKRLADIVAHVLERDGYDVDSVGDGPCGLRYAESGIYDAVILDVMLPGMSGYDVVREMRKSGLSVPVLMLTALGTVDNRIEGLDMGADSYMTKPFSPKELLARLRALMRRTPAAISAESPIRAGDLLLDEKTYHLSCGEEDIQLSSQEFAMAKLLMSNPGQTLTRSQIADGAWGSDAEVKGNSIDAYVSMLRKKLRFLRSCVEIRTERGIGYRLVLG